MAVLWDAESITNRVIERLRSKVSWNDILYISTNRRLIEAFAEEVAYEVYYNEYLTRENKWAIAQNRSSLVSFQDIHKYDAYRKIGATGTLRLSLSKDYFDLVDWDSTSTYSTNDEVSYSNKFYIAIDASTNAEPSSSPTKWTRIDVSPTTYSIDVPTYSIFSTTEGTKFTNTQSYALTTADDYIDISVIQGIPKNESYVATGIINEEFNIDNDSIENVFNKGYVNSTEWTEITDIFLAEATDTKYEIENELDFTGVFLKFGDSVTGKKLESGDTVLWEYIETDGADGDILSAGYVTTIDSTFYDTNSDEAILFCYNADRLEGGTDIESTESIRINAPNTFQTGDRATSKVDYKTIIEAFSYVLKTTVWGAYEVNIDAGNDPWTFIAGEENVVHVVGITTSEENLSTAQKLAISEGINEFKSPTDIVTFEDVIFVNLIFTSNIFISDRSFTLSKVISNVRTTLGDAYSVETLNFFEAIRFSDYQRLIDEVEGVEYHDTTVNMYTIDEFNMSFQYQINIPLIPVVTSSIKIYVQDTVLNEAEFLIATDDGAGTLVGTASYPTVTGIINYATGVGAFDLGSTLPKVYTNYSIRTVYEYDSKDLVLLERNQIFKYNDTNTIINANFTS